MFGTIASAGLWFGGVEPSGATDYTKDADCVFACYMNGETTEVDRSGASGNLSVSDGDTIERSTTVPTGYSGYSRTFATADADGLYHADELATDINGVDAQWTIVAWIYRSSVGATQAVVSKYNTSANRQYILYAGLDNDMGAFASGDGTNITQSWTPNNSIGSTSTWYHIAYVCDDVNLTGYLNGDVATSAGENPLSYTNGLYDGSALFSIGVRIADGGFGFDGLIDEVAVFKRALSESEIEEIMTYGIDGTNGGND
jgi:hypothetical protein